MSTAVKQTTPAKKLAKIQKVVKQQFTAAKPKIKLAKEIDLNDAVGNITTTTKAMFGSFAPILYTVIVVLLYLDFTSNPSSNTTIISSIMTYLGKFQVFRTFVSYFSLHSTKLFGILSIGFILVSSLNKSNSLLWTAIISAVVILLKDMPFITYVISSWSVSYYLHTGKKHKGLAALACSIPFIYYVFFIHFLDSSNGTWDQVDGNYTLPPIQYNETTTLAPTFSMRIKN